MHEESAEGAGLLNIADLERPTRAPVPDDGELVFLSDFVPMEAVDLVCLECGWETESVLPVGFKTRGMQCLCCHQTGGMVEN